MLKAKFLIPFAIFVVLAGFLFKGLYMDPRTLPSVLIDKPLPAFELPTVFDPNVKFKSEDMKGKVWMLNVWSTWCAPCKQEHPYLVALKRQGLKTPIVGLLYRDQPGAAQAELRSMGNPYDLVLYDRDNKVGIDLGGHGCSPKPSSSTRRGSCAPR